MYIAGSNDGTCRLNDDRAESSRRLVSANQSLCSS